MKFEDIFIKEEGRFNYSDGRLTSEDLENPFNLRSIQNFNNLTSQATERLIDFLESMGWLEEYKRIVFILDTLLMYQLEELIEGEDIDEEV